MTKEQALNEVAKITSTWIKRDREMLIAGMKRDPEFFSFVLCLAEAGASTQRQPA